MFFSPYRMKPKVFKYGQKWFLCLSSGFMLLPTGEVVLCFPEGFKCETNMSRSCGNSRPGSGNRHAILPKFEPGSANRHATQKATSYELKYYFIKTKPEKSFPRSGYPARFCGWAEWGRRFEPRGKCLF